MDLEPIIAHHLFDSAPYLKLFTVGGVEFNITKHLVIMWLIGAFMLALFTYAARGTSKVAVLLRTAIEGLALYLRNEVVNPILGREGPKYLHYFLTLFFFILFCNLGGMIPGSATATGNISVTGGLAFCSFAFVVFAGVKAQGGIIPFLKHFNPLMSESNFILKYFLGGFLFLLEFGGLMIKCGVLMVRLFANMIAGHIVILGIMSIIFIFAASGPMMGLGAGVFSVAMMTFINCLEILICVLQAFVFTLLTAVFVGGVLHAH